MAKKDVLEACARAIHELHRQHFPKSTGTYEDLPDHDRQWLIDIAETVIVALRQRGLNPPSLS